MKQTLLLGLAVMFLAAGVISLGLFGKLLLGSGDPSGPSIYSESVKYEIPEGVRDDQALTDWQLLNQDGKLTSSKDVYEGQVHVVCFFFSECPSICWQLNQAMGDLEDKYGSKGLKLASITCDPKVDTPKTLDRYADKLNAGSNWGFYTGHIDYLRRVASEIYQTSFDEKTHDSHLIIMDRWGNKRAVLSFNDEAEMKQVHALIPELLEERSEPEELKNKVREPIRAKTGLEDEDEMEGESEVEFSTPFSSPFSIDEPPTP